MIGKESESRVIVPDFECRNHSELMQRITALYEIKSDLVKRALFAVDRRLFVGEANQKIAYYDCPLKLPNFNQTISEPSLVARMLDALDPEEGQKILDIGTGSGYLAALLSHIVGENGRVISVEINRLLADMTKELFRKFELSQLGSRIQIEIHDGHNGFESEAPFDRIIVSALSSGVPSAWGDQLKKGGLLVAPIRGFDTRNPNEGDLRLFRGTGGGLEFVRDLAYVRFVPLVHNISE